MDQYATRVTTTKGRRTKRQRSLARCDVIGAGGCFGSNYSSSTASASASGNWNSEDQDIMSEITTEEEDMANCLILLAQGRRTTTIQKLPPVYECKTCNKAFHSFQALGGHRASHKKPKLASLPGPGPDPDHKNKGALVVVVVNKVHECSICGSEFPSGQALGGHMRRHRAPPPVNKSGSAQEQQPMVIRNVLTLDLNLPAPGDDGVDENNIGTTTFHRAGTVALVDCHY